MADKFVVQVQNAAGDAVIASEREPLSDFDTLNWLTLQLSETNPGEKIILIAGDAAMVLPAGWPTPIGIIGPAGPAGADGTGGGGEAVPAVTLASSLAGTAANPNNAGFYVHAGRVYLTGRFGSMATADIPQWTTLFTLPEGARIAQNAPYITMVSSNSSGYTTGVVQVQASGAVILNTPGMREVFLDSISFRLP